MLKGILRTLFHKNRIEEDLDAEIRSYIEHAIREKIEQGMPPDEARRAALIEFGGREQVKELVRESRSGAWLESLVQDLRYAIRGFKRSPGFLLVAVLTLAIGIGASTAVFSVVDRILFRSLPYPEEDRLVSIGVLSPLDANEFMWGGHYLKWRGEQEVFESMTAFSAAATVSGGAYCDLTEPNPTRLWCAAVESSFLPTLGIHPIVGRNFTPDEEQRDAPKVALISYGMWRSRFAGDEGIVGKVMPIDGRPTTIIGVLARDFEMPTLTPADILTPQAAEETSILRAFGRLKSGVSVQQAEAATRPMFEEAVRSFPMFRKDRETLKVQLLRDRQVHDVRLASWILFAAVLAVLLIACANLANLMLARATSRQREFAVRGAIGAGRGRLVRQLLTESALLSMFGGVLGCALAFLLLQLFVDLAPQGMPRFEQAALDLRVLVFSAGISLFSGLAFGLAPALRVPSIEVLQGRAASGTRSRLRQVLVGAQVAISLVLLTGAGLLLQTLWNLQSIPLGLRSEHVVTADINLGEQRYANREKQVAFFEELESRLGSFFGSGSLAISSSVPLAGPSPAMSLSGFEVEGRSRPQTGSESYVLQRIVTPDYFSVLGIPIVRGRSFNERDRDPAERVAVVSDRFARRLLGGEDPVGKRMRFGREGSWDTVIGVVADVKNNVVVTGSDEPELYLPRKRGLQSADTRASILLRTEKDTKSVSDLIRAEVARTDALLPVTIETMDQHLSRLTSRPRFNAVLLVSFAIVALMLAAVGLYGVISFLVAQRTQEIGVRMALGATSIGIMRMVLSQAFRWTLTGTLVGIVAALQSAAALRELLFQVPERDPWTLGVSVGLLFFVAIIAAWIPSRRAARVDPLTALRSE